MRRYCHLNKPNLLTAAGVFFLLGSLEVFMSYPKFTEYELEAFKEHEKELLDEEDSITQAIKDLKLDAMSRDALQRKAARWKLELDALEHPSEELLNKNIKNLNFKMVYRFFLHSIIWENRKINIYDVY